MRGLEFRAAVAAIVVVLVLVAGWLVLSPGWAVAMLQQRTLAELGRALDVKGGAHLAFSPELSIRLEQASLAGAQGQDGSFMTAQAIRIPVSVMQLVTRSPVLSAITLESPEFAFLVDERDQANWHIANVRNPAALRIAIERGGFRYFDARNGQSLTLTGANGIADVSADGGIMVQGSAEISGRLARISADIKSLARVHEDGSPLDLSIETAEASANFSGRLATAKVLSLVGPVALASPDLRAVARWAGLSVDDGTNYKQLSVTGALDSAGRAFAIRKAEVALDSTRASGDVVIDLRGDVPKLQAALVAERFTLDSFLPGSGATPGEWGTLPLGYEVLKSFDAEVTLETPAFTIAGLTDFPARAVLMLAKGRLQSSIAAEADALGATSLEATVDASAAPPGFEMKVKSGNAGALLTGLAGITWLKGQGSISADVSGAGWTQQEIIGTLKGSASIAATGGSVMGPDMTALLGAVSQRILDGWQDGGAGNTDFTALDASFTIADGIAATNDFKLQSPGIAVTASGEADLLRRALDLKAEPRLITQGTDVTAGLPVPVAIKGPWDNPRIYPDMKDILLNPAAAFSTLKTMGLPAGN